MNVVEGWFVLSVDRKGLRKPLRS